MGISPDPTVPDVIYLDEQAIDDILSYTEQGAISEIVERVSTKEESTKEGGLSKILTAKLRSREVEGSETEFVRTLDPIGKLAMLREAMLEDELLIQVDSAFTNEEREGLDRGNLVEVDSELQETPISAVEEAANRFMNLQEQIGDLIGVDEEDAEEVEEARQIISTLNREGDILRATTGESGACDFVLTYDEANFRSKGLGFPREGSEYTILGQVTTKFEEGDSIQLIDFVDLAERVEENPRKQKRQIRKFKHQFADAASTITGRDVTPDDFEISHPDVELKLLSIYR